MEDPKPRPNEREYIAILRAMTPQQRIKKAFELTEAAKQAAFAELRREFPEKSHRQIVWLYFERTMEGKTEVIKDCFEQSKKDFENGKLR